MRVNQYAAIPNTGPFTTDQTSTECTPIARGVSPNGGRGAEAVYRQGRMTASYVHFYFPSNPSAVAALFAPDREGAIAGKPAPTSTASTDPNVGGKPAPISTVFTDPNVGAGLPAIGP